MFKWPRDFSRSPTLAFVSMAILSMPAAMLAPVRAGAFEVPFAVAEVGRIATTTPNVQSKRGRLYFSRIGRKVHTGTVLKSLTVADQSGGGTFVAIARQSIGAGRSPGWPARWCGAWLASVARRAGYAVPANAALARAWAGAGVRVSPRPGVVMAMAHHVGIVIGVEGGRIVLLSGNHSGRVGIGTYPIGRALAFVALQ